MSTGNIEPDRHVAELIPAYVLSCLDSDETLDVTAHLAVCARCRAELGAYQKVMDELYLAVPQAAPPADLKGRLLREVEKKQAPVPAGKSPPAWYRLRSGQKSSAPAWGFVASLLVLVILGASNLWLSQRIKRLEASTPGDFQVIRLTGTDKAPMAVGILVMNQEGDQGTLVVEDLPGLNETQQYQLWLIRDGQRVSGGVFSVSEDGYGSLVVHSDQSLDQYTAFGITIEPAGGSSGPTGDKVLGGSRPGVR